MDFSAALPTFVITLREGVEAALVVGIVLACLKKSDQTKLNSWVYTGVGVGIIVSALVGIVFSAAIQILSTSNPEYAPVIEPLLEASFGLIAIAMLSWMLIWMTQQARFMKAEVEGAIASVLKENNSAGWGIFTLILIAVVREGFETVLFIAANFQQGFLPAFGAISGLSVAVLIGVALFKLGVRINIRRFFQIMGVLLILIVSGLVVSSLGKFDAAANALSQINRQANSLCFFYERFAKPELRDCILGPLVWNTKAFLPDDKFPGIVFKALLGYKDKIYIVQAISYLAFLITIGGIYFQSLSGRVIFPGKKKESVF